MTTLAKDHEVPVSKNRWQTAGQVGGIILVIAISIVIFLWGNQVENLPIYGYPAIFVLSIIGNATVILPAPGYLLVFAAGSALDPIGIGIVAGLGAALGELTGYIAGASGKGSIEDRPIFQQLEKGMERSGSIVIFLLGVLPNPFFDIGGMLAGATRLPLFRFLMMAWAGKSIRFTIIALSGSIWL